MDIDQSGKLGFNEFIVLWRHLRNWREIFKHHDNNNSNTITASELKEAFREVGIVLNRNIMRILINRYSHSNKNSVEDELYFDDFICCAIKVKRCIEAWNSKKDKGANGFPNALSILSSNLRGIGGLSSLTGPIKDTSSFTIDEVSFAWCSLLSTNLLTSSTVHSTSSLLLSFQQRRYFHSKQYTTESFLAFVIPVPVSVLHNWSAPFMKLELILFFSLFLC